MQPDELSSETQRSVTGVGEEERAISTFEEAFRRIKEATGVTDTRVLYTQRERERDIQRDIRREIERERYREREREGERERQREIRRERERERERERA